MGSVSAPESGLVSALLTALHAAAAAASEHFAYATSVRTSVICWDSKLLPVARPEPCL